MNPPSAGGTAMFLRPALYTLPKSLLLVTFVFLMTACDRLAALNNRIDPEEILAVDALRDRDVAAAERKLEGLLANKPNDPLGWTILGHIREDQDNDAGANEAYEKALAIDPKQFQALTGQGILARKRGDYEASMAFYQKAVAIDPDYGQAWSSMTTIAFKQGDDAKALQYARKGYALDKEDPVVVANLAIACHYNDLIDERDRMTELADRLGYRNMDLLTQIYSGELTLRD